MKTTRVTCPLLFLFTVGSLLGAQGTAQQPKPQPPKHQEPAHAAPKEASTPAVTESGAQLKFSVTGLSKDNLVKVKESLTGLASQSYVCEKCKHEQATPGKCSACNVDLKAEKHALFTSVMPSPDDSTVQLTLDPNATVRYTELEGALGKNSVKIDAAHFPIAGHARLVLRGGAADGAATVEKALKDAKLFDDVKASFDAATSETTVTVHAGAMPPTRAKVTTTLETAGVKATLADVIWGRPKMRA